MTDGVSVVIGKTKYPPCHRCIPFQMEAFAPRMLRAPIDGSLRIENPLGPVERPGFAVLGDVDSWPPFGLEHG